MNRALLLELHRYLGLALAPWLAVLGLTGSIIVFDPEIDTLLNPDLFRVEQPGAEPLAATELIRRVEASDPRIEAYYLALDDGARKASMVYVAPRNAPDTGEPYPVSYDEVFIDPTTGVINGRRLWGECCFERRNFVPFMYKLHNRLLLPLDVGRPLLGVVALLWLLLLVIGVYLTWPAAGNAWRNWRRAWRARRGRTGFLTTLNWHRASGLWLWPVSLVVALTGVVLGFEDRVSQMVNAVSPLTPVPERQRTGTAAAPGAASFTDAVNAARERVRREGFDPSPAYVSRAAEQGLYRVRFGDAYDVGLGEVTVYVAERDGRVLGLSTARGNTAGDLFMSANQPLHAGRIAGMPGRVLVFLGGIVAVGLSVTGWIMWVLRRRPRNRSTG